MNLEIGVESLLMKSRVETFRIEFKAGWNPDEIYHTVCAFANDYDNVGGGYILIGVEQDDNGIAVRPVRGVPDEELDQIQKQMLGYNNLLNPVYFPKTAVEEVDGRNVLVIWIPAGAGRPYKAPEYVTAKKNKKYSYYIRYGTCTVKANSEQEQELISMANMVPFDERPNWSASLKDISPFLLEQYLIETGSKLYDELMSRGAEAVLEDMHLLDGPVEDRHLKNAALMMFCEEPDKFFPYTQADIVKFPGGSVAEPNNFVEVRPIRGSVPTIIKRTMVKLQDMVIEEKVTKVAYQMEAIRRFSYPYQALEEAVVNAFYHRDYMSYEPVHIEIEPDHISIISFPGIDRSVSKETIEAGRRFVSRQCRNRRLGEFLKELDLSEGKSTGIPTIQDELARNGSPAAEFFTDDDRKAVRVEIPIHPDFLISRTVSAFHQVSDNVAHSVAHGAVRNRSDDVERIIMDMIARNNKVTRQEIADRAGVSRKTIERKLHGMTRVRYIGHGVSGHWEIVQP